MLQNGRKYLQTMRPFSYFKYLTALWSYKLDLKMENSNPLQCSCLEKAVWWATVCGVANSWTQLND